MARASTLETQGMLRGFLGCVRTDCVLCWSAVHTLKKQGVLSNTQVPEFPEPDHGWDGKEVKEKRLSRFW